MYLTTKEEPVQFQGEVDESKAHKTKRNTQF